MLSKLAQVKHYKVLQSIWLVRTFYKIFASEIPIVSGFNRYRNADKATEEILRRGFQHENQGVYKRKGGNFKHSLSGTISNNIDELARTKKEMAEIIASNMAQRGSTLDKIRFQQIKYDNDANKRYGKDQKMYIMRELMKESDFLINLQEESKHKDLFKVNRINISLVGRADAIVEYPDCTYEGIMQLKARTTTLFGVTEYDYVQMQAYCYLYDCEIAYLVQNLTSKHQSNTGIHLITRDPRYWQCVVQRAKSAFEGNPLLHHDKTAEDAKCEGKISVIDPRNL